MNPPEFMCLVPSHVPRKRTTRDTLVNRATLEYSKSRVSVTLTWRFIFMLFLVLGIVTSLVAGVVGIYVWWKGASYLKLVYYFKMQSIFCPKVGEDNLFLHNMLHEMKSTCRMSGAQFMRLHEAVRKAPFTIGNWFRVSVPMGSYFLEATYDSVSPLVASVGNTILDLVRNI